MVTIHKNDIDAVIFDMDGTMVNNMGYHKKAWKEYVKQNGIELSDDDFRSKSSGANNAKILHNIFGREFSSEEVSRRGSEKEALYRQLYAPALTPVPGLIEFIQHIKNQGLKIGLATTAIRANREFILNKLGLSETFDSIIGDEDVHTGKPDPEIYLLATKQLGVVPNRCITFEDSPPGVVSAKGAGVHVIGVLTGHTKEELHQADNIINDFRDVEIR